MFVVLKTYIIQKKSCSCPKFLHISQSEVNGQQQIGRSTVFSCLPFRSRSCSSVSGINIKIEYCPPLKNKKYETTTAGGGSVILTFERGPSSFGHRGTTGRYVCPAFYYFILTITPLFSYNIRVNLGAMVSSPFLSQSRIGDNISQAE